LGLDRRCELDTIFIDSNPFKRPVRRDVSLISDGVFQCCLGQTVCHNVELIQEWEILEGLCGVLVPVNMAVIYLERDLAESGSYCTYHVCVGLPLRKWAMWCP
jgi:hypothetical protein